MQVTGARHEEEEPKEESTEGVHNGEGRQRWRKRRLGNDGKLVRNGSAETQAFASRGGR